MKGAPTFQFEDFPVTPKTEIKLLQVRKKKFDNEKKFFFFFLKTDKKTNDRKSSGGTVRYG